MNTFGASSAGQSGKTSRIHDAARLAKRVGLGVAQGQGGMMMDCPMMQRIASLDQRARQLEERAGIPTPPAEPSAPAPPR